MRIKSKNYYVVFYKCGKFLIIGAKSEKEINSISERVVAIRDILPTINGGASTEGQEEGH